MNDKKKKSENLGMSDKALCEAKERIGQLLKRLKRVNVGKNGKPMTNVSVCKSVGISLPTLTHAERGRVSLENFLRLLDHYDNLQMLEVFEMLDGRLEPNALRKRTLTVLSERVPMSTTEFLDAVSMMPDAEYKVSHRTYLDVSKMGFATRFVTYNSVTRYYAATFSFAKEHPDLEFKMTQISFEPDTRKDPERAEFFKWINGVVMEAIKERPEFKNYLT